MDDVTRFSREERYCGHGQCDAVNKFSAYNYVRKPAYNYVQVNCGDIPHSYLWRIFRIRICGVSGWSCA